MRAAMAGAEVGDDVLGDDPTVQRLESMAAQRLGKEAALFVASGTMANLVSLLVHCQRGEEAIVGDQAHSLNVEVAGAAGLGGIQLRAARNDPYGRLDLDEVRSLVRPPGLYNPRTAVIALENTHNSCHGSVLTAEYTAEVAAIAHANGAVLHIDGARIFNAAVALQTTAAALAAPADSVTFCLSKGLSCPVGSLICGPEEFIRHARKVRRMVGGGMRQVGVLAAAGIVGLNEMVDRLAEDHANARRLAEGITRIPGLRTDLGLVQTNIVFVTLDGIDGVDLIRRLQDQGLLCSGTPTRLRFVTHHGIEAEDIDRALEVMQTAVTAPV
jgi:threonine aldolase